MNQNNPYIEYRQNDIHQEIKNIPSGTIDFIYTSPPYGITKAKWDKPLDWKNLFPEMWRILKPNGVIALHCSMPFTYELLKYETPKYHYTWKKNNSTGGMNAKYQPLRDCEEIMIYNKIKGTYNPQMRGNEVIQKRYMVDKSTNNYLDGSTNKNLKSFVSKTESHTGRYPTTFLEYPIRPPREKSGISRCNEMIDFFIKTYTNEKDSVLDMTCCNEFVGDRCRALNRNYLGIDIQLKPYDTKRKLI